MTNSTKLSPKAVNRRYLREFGIAMLAYVIVMFLCTYWLNSHPASAWRIMAALLPLIPIAGVFLAVLRYMAHTDEMLRRLQLQALAISAGLTAFLVLTYGLLETVGFPKLSAWWAFICVDVLWGISVFVLKFRLTHRWFEKCL